MLKRLKLNNVTRFDDLEISFGPGINVLVGANSTGKTHLLKVGYAILLAESELAIKNGSKATKEQITSTITSKLGETFFPPSKSLSITPLIKRQQGARSANIACWLGDNGKPSWQLEFNDKRSSTPIVSKSELVADITTPIFIPAKEVLSMHKGLRGLYTNGQLSVDRTYVDLCDRLDPPLLLGPNQAYMKPLLDKLTKIIGGKVIKDKSSDFYVKFNSLNVEINLVSEGYRKIATLLYLIGNGSLSQKTTLFWDEPEANLNPKLIRGLAGVLVDMANQGFQIVLATHSLFLIRELQIITKNPDLLKFHGLYEVENMTNKKKQQSVLLSTTEDYLDLEEIPSLDAEIEQLNTQV